MRIDMSTKRGRSRGVPGAFIYARLDNWELHVNEYQLNYPILPLSRPLNKRDNILRIRDMLVRGSCNSIM